ncbi:MAG TPA: glycosyltransferase family 4 protein [Candidatus Binataceae bacterium]|nr:glycosyltransferase family 4 protein [Candidatus Binataceae bacterium]
MDTNKPAFCDKQSKALLIVQFGNYAEAVHRFSLGGGETYYGQRYTVSYVASLIQLGYRVKVVSLANATMAEHLPSGVESSGIQLYPGRFQRPRIPELIQLATEWKPSHLLLQSPIVEMLHWAKANRVEALPFLADSFGAGGFRNRWRHHRLARALNDESIRWVVNHGPDACADLARIGVNREKLLPFDWPSFDTPSKWKAKRAPKDTGAIAITYVGRISDQKGVGDVLDALALAHKAGDRYHATFVGNGDIEDFQRRADRMRLSEFVEFTGLLPRQRALERMNAGDVVVVPSRHEYPEGMPQTIYEGLVSRSPVLVSDHPMFTRRIMSRQNGVVFHASNPQSLYEALRELVRDEKLYEKLSGDSDKNAQSFHGPLKWDQVLTRWLSGKSDDDAWLSQFALSRSSSTLSAA